MFVSTLLLSATVLAQSPDQPTLPLRRLRLYETGVGYFERDGNVGEKRDAALPLPASHLDDALKTLVVLSDGAKVEIGGIQFASSLSQGMARAIAGLPQGVDEGEADYENQPVELAYVDLLTSLEGAEIEAVAGRKRVRGKLVEVLGPFDQSAPVAAPADSGQQSPAPSPAYPREPEYTLVVRTDAGALVRIQTDDLESVRPTDPAASSRMEVALAALSSRSAQAEHPLEVQIRGSGPLRLGYIAETPVWRTTYRVVMRDAGGATLQAWALIHNDTDENWRDVDIELVNGQPTSFLFPLAAPRYTRRELAEPEVELATVPQLLNVTPDRLYGDNIGESYGVGGLGLVGTGRGGGGSGEGTIGLGSTGTIGYGGMAEPSLGDMARFAQATGEESGSLFTYRLANGLDLDAHHSALVPVVQETIDAEPITWFAVGEDRGRSAARMLNSSGQTLPTGTVSFFDDRGFVGESGLDRLKAGEQAYVIYGMDLDVDLERSYRAVSEKLSAAVYTNGKLHETYVVETARTFALRNRGGQSRVVYAVLDVKRNATVEGHDAIDFDHDRGLSLARFEVGARGEFEKTLRIKQTDHRATEVEALDVQTLRRLNSSHALSDDQRTAAGEAAQTLEDIDAVRELEAAGQVRLADLGRELERLREDLRAVGTVGLKDRTARNLARRVVETESTISQLEASQKRRATRLADLDARLREQLSGI